MFCMKNQKLDVDEFEVVTQILCSSQLQLINYMKDIAYTNPVSKFIVLIITACFILFFKS